jgi:hypothetical protein
MRDEEAYTTNSYEVLITSLRDSRKIKEIRLFISVTSNKKVHCLQQKQ